MRFSHLLPATLLVAASATLAAPPTHLTLDQSSAALMDAAGAQAVWTEQLAAAPVARLAKLYPVGRYGFISQVEGGFTEAKVCVVTARAMLAPRAGKALLFKPEKMATTFDAQPNLTEAQCKDLARAKLKEAIGAVLSSLVAR